jgi:PKHD-type hydroxylase
MAETSSIAIAVGRNAGVGLSFNRPNVFSTAECEALIRWAESQPDARLERVDYHLPSQGGQAFTRRNRQFVAAPATRDRAVSGFCRKLRGWVATLNEQIWRFDVTRFTTVLAVRYQSGDEVGLHMDLGQQYCDRKLAAFVQLSPEDGYEGGVLAFGLPLQAACREQGSLLVFPAWLPHQVSPVTSGTRYSAIFFALGPVFR